MSETGTLIAKAMIQQDASFIAGLLLAMLRLNEDSGIPFIFASMDFSSLIVYEASQFYLHTNPSMDTDEVSKLLEVIKQSRQRVKLFDDKVLGMDGVGNLFLNTLTPVHQRELSKDHLFPLPKMMWTDIGVYLESTTGICVGTTHLATFNTGLADPSQFFSPEASHDLGQNLGRFLRIFAKEITLVRINEVSITSKDMRYNQIYAEQRYGSKNEQVNAGLSVIDMRMNFLALLVTQCAPSATIFKWKFLGIYHAISSLNLSTKSEHFANLNSRHKEAIRRVLASPIAILMLNKSTRPLRNTLSHYGIDTRIDIAKLSGDASKLFGLVEAALPDWTYDSLHDFMDEQLQTVLLDMFGVWRSD